MLLGLIGKSFRHQNTAVFGMEHHFSSFQQSRSIFGLRSRSWERYTHWCGVVLVVLHRPRRRVSSKLINIPKQALQHAPGQASLGRRFTTSATRVLVSHPRLLGITSWFRSDCQSELGRGGACQVRKYLDFRTADHALPLRAKLLHTYPACLVKYDTARFKEVAKGLLTVQTPSCQGS